MRQYKKHHSEHLDGTRGTWRPSLVATLYGSDGHPVAWKEIVIVSCHSCGGQFGVGADGPQITNDGVPDDFVTCCHCKCSNPLSFEKFNEPEGREHFGRLKAFAENEVKEARIRHLQKKIQQQMLENLQQAALEEAKKLIPDDAKNPQELYKKALEKF